MYYTDETEAERFYSDILGMRQIIKVGFSIGPPALALRLSGLEHHG